MNRKYKLGELLDVKRGMSLPGEYYSESGKYVRLTLGNFDYPNGGFKTNISKKDIYYTGDVKPEFILHAGDIITPLTEQTYGLLGETAKIPEDDKYIQSGDVGLVLPNKNLLDDNFAYYLISSSNVKKQLSAGAQQTKIRHTSPEKIKDCIVYIPELAEQKKIGLLLSKIDQKIELNKAITHNLEQQLKTIYEYWFIQFDFPDKKGNPYCSSGNLMEYNQSVRQNIPLGWTVGSIKNNLLSDIIKPGVDPFDTKIYLDTGAVSGSYISAGEEIQYSNRPGRANMQPKVYSIWFAKMKNSVKHLFFSCSTSSTLHTLILSTGFFGLQCNEFSFEYLSSFVEFSYFEEKKNMLAHGATQEAINENDLELIPLIIPSNNVLKSYHDLTSQIYNQIGSIVCENKTLSCLRDELIPIFMNGQLSIKE